MLWYYAVAIALCAAIPAVMLAWESVHWARFRQNHGLSRDVLSAGHHLRHYFESTHRVNLSMPVRERIMHAIADLDARKPGFAERIRWMESRNARAWAAIERVPGMAEAVAPYRDASPRISPYPA